MDSTFRWSFEGKSTHLASRAAAALAMAFALAVATPRAQAQTYTVIHTFGGADGVSPWAGLTMDAGGNLYGTARGGGTHNDGTVFRLRKSGSGWVLNTLYSFAGGNDGTEPRGRVSLARDGTLYGTTFFGGGPGCYNGNGCGTIFHLIPPPVAPRSALTPWNETVLYRFSGGSDGGYPRGDLTFDPPGNIYGTADYGGDNYGVIYELMPSNGGWTQTVIYTPQGSGGGTDPQGGVIFDRAGSLDGVFEAGGQYGYGTVYQLSPSGSDWTEQTLYAFTGERDGQNPVAGLIIDSSGNLYGATSAGGTYFGGTVFELTPNDGGWTYNWVYGFLAGGVVDKLVMDAAGNLYGTTQVDGAYRFGAVFKLSPLNGGWIYKSLYDFTGRNDGAYPMSNLVFDANGNLYGTTSEGGSPNCLGGCGVVFEITP